LGIECSALFSGLSHASAALSGVFGIAGLAVRVQIANAPMQRAVIGIALGRVRIKPVERQHLLAPAAALGLWHQQLSWL